MTPRLLNNLALFAPVGSDLEPIDYNEHRECRGLEAFLFVLFAFFAAYSSS